MHRPRPDPGACGVFKSGGTRSSAAGEAPLGRKAQREAMLRCPSGEAQGDASGAPGPAPRSPTLLAMSRLPFGVFPREFGFPRGKLPTRLAVPLGVTGSRRVLCSPVCVLLTAGSCCTSRRERRGLPPYPSGMRGRSCLGTWDAGLVWFAIHAVPGKAAWTSRLNGVCQTTFPSVFLSCFFFLYVFQICHSTT